jgi:hypothetical protein
LQGYSTIDLRDVSLVAWHVDFKVRSGLAYLDEDCLIRRTILGSELSAQFEPFRHRLYDSNSTVSRVDLLPCSEYANSLQGKHIAANGFGIAPESPAKAEIENACVRATSHRRIRCAVRTSSIAMGVSKVIVTSGSIFSRRASFLARASARF